MFKVNTGVFIVNFEQISHLVLIAKFEHVNADCDNVRNVFLLKITQKMKEGHTGIYQSSFIMSVLLKED